MWVQICVRVAIYIIYIIKFTVTNLNKDNGILKKFQEDNEWEERLTLNVASTIAWAVGMGTCSLPLCFLAYHDVKCSGWPFFPHHGWPESHETMSEMSLCSLELFPWIFSYCNDKKLLTQRNTAFLFILMKKISKCANMIVAPVLLNCSFKTFKVNISNLNFKRKKIK